jgi:hypothetical protein
MPPVKASYLLQKPRRARGPVNPPYSGDKCLTSGETFQKTPIFKKSTYLNRWFNYLDLLYKVYGCHNILSRRVLGDSSITETTSIYYRNHDTLLQEPRASITRTTTGLLRKPRASITKTTTPYYKSTMPITKTTLA